MSNLILPRRSFLTGMAAMFAAPAIVRASSLMPIKSVLWEPTFEATFTNNLEHGDVLNIIVNGRRFHQHVITAEEAMGGYIELGCAGLSGPSDIQIEHTGFSAWSNAVHLEIVD